MSVLTALGYFVADMIVGQQKAITTSQVRMENIDFSRQTQVLFADKDACENTLTGDSTANPSIPPAKLDLSPDANGKYSSIAMPDASQAIRDKGGSVVFEKGGSYGGGALTLTSISVQNKSVPSSGGAGQAELTFLVTFNKGNMKGHSVSRKLLLNVATDNSGNIIGCDSLQGVPASAPSMPAKEQLELAQQTHCGTIGGIYNNADGTCLGPSTAEMTCSKPGGYILLPGSFPDFQNCRGENPIFSYTCSEDKDNLKGIGGATSKKSIAGLYDVLFPKITFQPSSSQQQTNIDYVKTMPSYLVTNSQLFSTTKETPWFFGKAVEVIKNGADFTLRFKVPIKYADFYTSAGVSITYQPADGLVFNGKVLTSNQANTFKRNTLANAHCVKNPNPLDSSNPKVGHTISACNSMGGLFSDGHCTSPYEVDQELQSTGSNCKKEFTDTTFILKCQKKTTTCRIPKICPGTRVNILDFSEYSCPMTCTSSEIKQKAFRKEKLFKLRLTFNCSQTSGSEYRPCSIITDSSKLFLFRRNMISEPIGEYGKEAIVKNIFGDKIVKLISQNQDTSKTTLEFQDLYPYSILEYEINKLHIGGEYNLHYRLLNNNHLKKKINMNFDLYNNSPYKTEKVYVTEGCCKTADVIQDDPPPDPVIKYDPPLDPEF